MSDLLNHVSGKFVDAFAASISDARFKRYYRVYPVVDPNHPVDRDKLDAIAIYMWNTALSEALYPCLQMAEVVFRNALYRAIHELTNDSQWYKDPFLLEEKQQQQVVDAEKELFKAKKLSNPSRIIPELAFGFWVTLYSDTYLQKIVHPTLQSVFPDLSPKMRKHSTVQGRLQRVRTLRNRVFHHEPIWHMPDLVLQYEETLELIQWINRECIKAHISLDRFITVHQAGWQPYRTRLDRMLEDEAIQRMADEEATTVITIVEVETSQYGE